MSSIAKFCANNLRAFSHNYGVTLKSTHAHELVAAILGYKSKAAMLADIHSKIDNIYQMQLLVLRPSQFIADRGKCLEGLPPNLPDTYALSQEMFEKLTVEKGLSFRVFPSWEHLAKELTKEYLCKQGDFLLSARFGHNEKARNIFSKPLYEFKPKIEIVNNSVELSFSNRYYSSSELHFQPIDVNVIIKLHRVVGYVGYANPEILVNSSDQTVDSEV